jgi:cytochrome c
MNFREPQALLVTLFSLSAIALVCASPGAAGAGSLDGKDVFAKRCSGCHGTDASKEGPRLRGVIGRRAGTVPGFQYSDALRNSGIVWNEGLVNKWLESTEGLVKDNDMEFHVSNPDERAAVIGYLKSLTN